MESSEFNWKEFS